MPILLQNAILADLDPIHVERGSLRIEDGLIAERGIDVARQPGDEVVECDGSVVLPGLVNGHTHLYSTLAVGMPPPPEAPQNFREILERIWWRLDKALDAESIETSARIGALDALRCGTTTLIDHHASPSAIAGSLDLVERALDDVGLRGVLCYETTDRHGREGREAGIEENRRWLECCMTRQSGCFAGLVGGHASFTLEDESLDELAALAVEYDSGVHIHVAEDPCDEEQCQEQHQMFLIDRLVSHGLLKPASVFAHGTHLDIEAAARVSAAGVTLAHNPRSNMNNAVGYAPLPAFHTTIMLGTDGIGADMFAEAKAAWYAARHEQAGLIPADIVAMLAASAQRASAALDVSLGKLNEGAAADVVLTDYVPSTPLTSENLADHFVFAMSARHVVGVLVAGQWKLRERGVVVCDERSARESAADVARRLWQRMVAD